MTRALITGVAALFLATVATALDDPLQVFPQGAVLQCGDLRMSKSPDGKMQLTDATGRPKYGEFPIEMKGNQIFLDGKPCVWKCAQSVRC
jgi:hypothetical protein